MTQIASKRDLVATPAKVLLTRRSDMSVLMGMKPHTSDNISGGRSSIVQISGWKGAENGRSGGLQSWKRAIIRLGMGSYAYFERVKEVKSDRNIGFETQKMADRMLAARLMCQYENGIKWLKSSVNHANLSSSDMYNDTNLTHFELYWMQNTLCFRYKVFST